MFALQSKDFIKGDLLAHLYSTGEQVGMLFLSFAFAFCLESDESMSGGESQGVRKAEVGGQIQCHLTSASALVISVGQSPIRFHYFPILSMVQ